MNIKKFASVAQLVEIKLDSEELVAKYGEAITFYTYDVVNMATYFEFFNARTESQFTQLDTIMKTMILDENGKRVLADNEDLPVDIAAAAISKIGEILGKQQGKPLTPSPGAPQE